MKKFILLTICLFVSFTAFSQTTTSQAGAWNSGATWGGSVPTSGTNVVIAHDVTCNSEQTAGTITVNSGITLTVNTAGKLTANGEVTNNGTIVVTGGENASGSLIATASSSFTYTYKLYIPATEWKLVGIPVTNLTVDDIDNDLATNGSKVGIGYYDSTSSSWVVLLSSATTTLLDQTRGYEMMHSTGAVVDFTGGLRTSNRSTTTTFLNALTSHL